MKNLIVNQFRARRQKILGGLEGLYAETTDVEQIRDIQLARFNDRWLHACTTIPFYQHWMSKYNLPKQIRSLDELSEFPILTKDTIVDNTDLMAQTPGIERYTLTGGTSGISTAFPMAKSDADSAWVNTHLGRSWNGIVPGDKLFLIWGHSHLFSGRGALLKQSSRYLKDKLNNIKRVSAYKLDDDHLANMFKKLKAFRPKYLIGYGSCLSQLCTFLESRNLSLRNIGIHRVVNTSETLDEIDAGKIKSIFGCPVVNEYGMAETGVLGYSKGDLYPISVFWNDYILRSVDHHIIVSTIGSRCFPLINYDTEDISDDSQATSSMLSLNHLLGKARDIFSIRDKFGKEVEVSVVLFDHIFKQLKQIKSLHYELLDDGALRILYTSENLAINDEELLDQYVDGMKQEGIDVDCTTVKFCWLPEPRKTIAGKRQTLTKLISS